jgi:NAD+ synthase
MNKNYNQIALDIEKFIKKHCHNKTIIIGISGGIDSALTAKLAVNALGKNKVFGLVMPSAGTSKGDLKDAIAFTHSLGIDYQVLNINKAAKQMFLLANPETRSHKENIDGRIRSAILYAYANKINNSKVLGTINKTEWMLGYFPKHALIGDLLPIAGLLKTQVHGVSVKVGIPNYICKKIPKIGINLSCAAIEEFFSIPLNQIDRILYLIDKGYKRDEIIKKGFPVKSVERIFRLYNNAAHKRIYQIPIKNII